MAGWDVGERPTIRMAYIEYPEYSPRVGGTREQSILEEQERE